MKLHSLRLMSKNNKKRGSYIYSAIVTDGEKYYYCRSVRSICILKKKDININELEIIREIPKEYYKANGIKI